VAVTKEKPFYEDVLIAGFGGQGLMFIGKLLAFSAMKEGKNVTWIPSYGPEMRGGKANCTVVVSQEEIGSPLIPHPRALIIMNNPSLEAFEPRLQTDGLLLFNNSFVTRALTRNDIRVVSIPANEMAATAGDERAANMVMLGVYIACTKVVSKESVENGLRELFEKKIELLEINMRAFEEGMKFVQQKHVRDKA
jgi:2-oxoglutarate ferredoxin oxidoreductase subunit gamma